MEFLDCIELQTSWTAASRSGNGHCNHRNDETAIATAGSQAERRSDEEPSRAVEHTLTTSLLRR